MREKFKNVLLNSVIIFMICFLVLLLFQTYQDYNYYSIYSREELAEFFSMKEVLLWNIQQALYWSVLQMIIFVPILMILERTNIKNIYKILTTVVLTIIITFIYVISHLTIVF